MPSSCGHPRMPSAPLPNVHGSGGENSEEPPPNEGVVANVSTFGEPAFEQIRLVAFIRDETATAIFVARSAVGP